jgi:periplasmic protein TonB
MGTESVVSSETIYENLQHLADPSHVGETDGLEWVTGRVVPSKNRIWQNLFIAASLHLALAFALLLVPLSVIKPSTRILQVQLVSLGGDGDLASPGAGPPGDGFGASEKGKEGTSTLPSTNPSEDRNANSSAMTQLIARTNEPDASEVLAPVPDKKPVALEQITEPAATKAPEALKNAAIPTARPFSSAKKDAQKTPPKAAKADSEAESRLPSAPSCPPDAPQPGDQGQGESPSAGPGIGEGSGTASSSHGAGASFGNGPFETRFGSPNGPRFLRREIPNYPHQARQMAKEGTVVLHITIDEAGRPVEIDLVKKAGCGFDEEAIKAVKNSTFAPARREGKPITCKAVLPIRFVLKNAEED